MNKEKIHPPSTLNHPPLVYSYTRAQAVADGLQVEVTKTAREAGVKFPVFLTRTVYEAYVTVPPNVSGQDEAGRLWDIVWMTRFAILRLSTINHQPADACPSLSTSATTTAPPSSSSSSPLAAHWTLTIRSPPSP